MFLLNKTFIEKLDKHRRRFFGMEKSRKKGTIWSDRPEFVDRKKVD
jgi:hypothetical protein